jgi:hypothetical protein
LNLVVPKIKNPDFHRGQTFGDELLCRSVFTPHPAEAELGTKLKQRVLACIIRLSKSWYFPASRKAYRQSPILANPLSPVKLRFLCHSSTPAEKLFY